MSALGLLELTFSGGRLRRVRNRPLRPSPLPGILPPDPHLLALIARPQAGKTSLALWLAKRWVSAEPPWEGSDLELPGSRCLVVSREQTVVQIDALLCRFGSDIIWEDGLSIVAKDPELAPELAPLLTLDGEGHRALRTMLAQAQAAASPFGLVILDSLSRLKPSTIDENDNTKMSGWLDELESIAVEFDVYILLIHHKGHGGEGRSTNPGSAGRGASAIGAVTAAQLLLEVGATKRTRTLTVEGNFVLGEKLEFDVAGEDDHENAIEFFRIRDRFSQYDPGELIGSETISTNELAKRISAAVSGPGKNPPGADTRRAGELRDHWANTDLVEVVPGPRNAKMLRLKHLASSPPPRPAAKAKSVRPTSPTPPIGAGVGEVEESDDAYDPVPEGAHSLGVFIDAAA